VPALRALYDPAMAGAPATRHDRFAPERRGPGPAALRPLQDFVNTKDALRGSDDLQAEHQLHAFLDRHGLLDAKDTVTAADLVDARHVREALRAFFSRESGHLSPADIAVLDEVGRRSRLRWRFSDRGDIGLEASRQGVAGSLGSLLAPLVSAGIDGSLDRLKACRNCGWLFFDRSKNRSGAWCSMELCGSRAKAKRHYWKVRSRQ
jgi:predicted RNA-binding Zn ribbon-like protein